jgi:peptidoglycan/LPS O-acetylase OafA/YrhL
VEAFLYAAFLGLSFYRQRVAAYAILVAVGLVALSAWAPHGMASTFDFGAFRGLAGFFTGALLARLPARAPGAIVELSVVAIVAAFVSLGRMTILSPLVFALPVYVFAQSQGWVGHLLRGRAAVWLGERSYSIYMVHGVLLGLLFALADRLGLHRSAPILESPSAVRSVVILAGYVLSIIALSAVTYELIEQPGRAIFNRFAGIKPRIGESLAATS